MTIDRAHFWSPSSGANHYQHQPNDMNSLQLTVSSPVIAILIIASIRNITVTTLSATIIIYWRGWMNENVCGVFRHTEIIETTHANFKVSSNMLLRRISAIGSHKLEKFDSNGMK